VAGHDTDPAGASAPDSSSSASVVYLDHAATSWPKPPGVVEAMSDAIVRWGANPGRGAHRMALEASRLVHGTRADVAALLGAADPRDVMLVSGCTEACNVALVGSLSPGDRVVVSSMEHNSVARPLRRLAAAGVEVVVVDADETGLVDADVFEAAVRAAPTRAVVCQHASNVTGTVQPIADLTDIAHAAGAVMIVDGAQGAGHLAVDVQALGVDAYACAGHKALLGPQGVGVLYLAPGFEPREAFQGGTGATRSEGDEHPMTRPERYEAGTRNLPGIAGLGAGVRYVAGHGHEIRERESALCRKLASGLRAIAGMRVLGPGGDEPRVPIVSVVHGAVDPDRLAYELDRRFAIATRAGLHCAPWAHSTVGTAATGALRVSLGWSTTDQDVDLAIEALRECVS
jgi:cysteine desulfurase family protein